MRTTTTIHLEWSIAWWFIGTCISCVVSPGKQPPDFSRLWHRTSSRGTIATASLPHSRQISMGHFLQLPHHPLSIRLAAFTFQNPQPSHQRAHRSHVRIQQHQHQHHPQDLPIHKPHHNQYPIKLRLNRHHRLRRPRLSLSSDGHHNRHSSTPQNQRSTASRRRTVICGSNFYLVPSRPCTVTYVRHNLLMRL